MDEALEIRIRNELRAEGLPDSPVNIALVAKSKIEADKAIKRLEGGRILRIYLRG